jgi:ABC-2 type transport system ATP-binding protein
MLFLDEPTTGVDPVSRREFWRIIAGLHRQGITVFVATPYMDEADRCNEIAFMSQGRIILRDTPAGMKKRVPGRVVEVAVSDYRAAMPVLERLPFVTSVEVSGEMLRVLVDCAENNGCEDEMRTLLTASGLSVEHVRPASTDLEMAFATLIPSADVPKREDEPAELEVRQ